MSSKTEVIDGVKVRYASKREEAAYQAGYSDSYEFHVLEGHSVEKWVRVTAREESLPPVEMKKVEMLLVTKTDGDFIAMTTGDQLRRLAASGNPKIANYYWRAFVSPVEAEHE